MMKKTDLEFFKNLLLSRKGQILKNIEDANTEISNIDIAEMKEDADIASVDTNIIIDHALRVKQYKELDEINNSLKKMDDDLYGICEMCEEDIGIPRLKVKPHAKYCIICREIYEKTK